MQTKLPTGSNLPPVFFNYYLTDLPIAIYSAGSVPAASNSRMPPLPHEPAGFYNDRGATVDIPLDSTKVIDLHCFCYYHDLSLQSTFWSRLTLFLYCAF